MKKESLHRLLDLGIYWAEKAESTKGEWNYEIRWTEADGKVKECFCRLIEAFFGNRAELHMRTKEEIAAIEKEQEAYKKQQEEDAEYTILDHIRHRSG